MKKVFGFLITAILLSSCSLVKDVQFNKDNSGSMSVYIDMKEFVEKMGKGEMPEKTKKDLSIFSEPNSAVDSMSMIEFVEKTEGISSVTEIKDHEAFKYGMNFKFESLAALNNALNRMKYFQSIKEDSLVKIESFEYFAVSKKEAIVKEPVSESETDESTEKMAQAMGKMLSMAYNCRFEGKTIKSFESDFTVNKISDNEVSINLPADKMDGRTSEIIAKIKLK